MDRPTRWRFSWLLLPLLALAGCPSPAAPPGPPAEIPSALTIPRDLSLDVSELEPSSGGSALTLKSLTNSDIRRAINASSGTIKETNAFLDGALFPVSQASIPVDAGITTFSVGLEADGVTHEIKYDFGRFDLNDDGALESCSGCTCPVGCAPDLAVCPTSADDEDLKPICVRLWVDGARYLAGVFDRVPTTENAESGRIRVLIPTTGELGGSNLGIVYNHHDPVKLTTELSMFLSDPDTGTSDFFSRRHTAVSVEGPESHALKTARLSDALFDDQDSTLQFQSQYFSDLDFVLLETIATGQLGADGALGVKDITPPLCAQISSANPVSDILCEDIGLSLTPGDFPTLPEITEVQLPSLDQFPETPTF